ncbi:shikimate kinase [Postechiella marina]|uniref:Shikimate kinase n=1 Tax=Postechiella marina TaxID=943941 RepID=A0ABP8C8X9_9FLAO
MIIVLIGYMASGKSSIGKKIAKKLNYNLVDLDDLIEEREHLSVSEIFKTKGEVYFRKQEALYLKNQIESNTNLILSLGGGTPCYGTNMDYILEANNVKSVYLKGAIPTLVSKLIKKKSTRPLIAHIETEEAMTEFVGKHLFERSYYYNKAEIIINIDNKTKKEIANEIVTTLF